MLSASVAAEIRAHMAREMISQATLAERINQAGRKHVTAQWVLRRLKARVAIDLDDLVIMTEALGIDPGALLLAAGLPESASA